MSEEFELLVLPGKWEINYNYVAGQTLSRFFHELKNNGRIMAVKCPKCQRVLLPPFAYCERCFVPTGDNWVEIEPSGTLESFSIVTEKFDGAPEPPYVTCYVRLGQASTTVPNFLTGVDLTDIEKAKEKIKVGMRVKAVFKDKSLRQGQIRDFSIVPE